MKRSILAAMLLSSLALASFGPAVSAAPSKNIVETAIAVNEETGKFDTLLAAAQCGYLGTTVTDILASPDKTLFAPTDRAFRKLGEALGVDGGLRPKNVCSVDTLLGDGTLLTVLGYHVIDDRVTYREAKQLRGSKVEMLLGGKARIGGRPDALKIDGSLIIIRNVRASNGIIHAVKDVLTPPALG